MSNRQINVMHTCKTSIKILFLGGVNGVIVTCAATPAVAYKCRLACSLDSKARRVRRSFSGGGGGVLGAPLSCPR